MRESTPTAPVARNRLMAASALGMVMFGATQVAPPVCLDAIGRDLGLNFEQRGLLLALRMAALTACLLFVGHFGECRAKRHILFAGLVAIAIGQLLAARAGGFHPMLVAMLVSGLGFGVFEALINPLIAQLHPDDSAPALNVMNGLFSVGLVAGALSVGELMEAGHSWRFALSVWMVPPLVCAALYMTPRYPPPMPGTHGADTGPEVRRFLRTPLFWVLLLSMALGGGAEVGMTSWAPNLVAEMLDASARGGAWTTILYGAFMAVGRFGTGAVVMRIGTVRVMIVSAVLCGAAMLALASVHVLWGAYVLFGLGGLFVACFWPTLLSLASDNISRGSTSLFSLLGAAGVSGGVLVPWTIGRVGDAFGLRSGALVFPVLMALLVLMLLIAARLTRRGNGDGSASAHAREGVS